MTTRQINVFLTAIIARQGRDKSFLASLQGIDLKIPTETDAEPIELSQEQKDLMKAAQTKAFERKQKHGR